MSGERTERPSRIFSAEDARRKARRRLPKLVFDYIDGAAGGETTPRRNRRAFEDVLLQPRVLENVTVRTLQHDLLGDTYGRPFGVAPMGLCRLSHPKADRFLADAAVERNMPICLSTAASTSIEDMATMAGRNAWFQLYAGPSEPQTLSYVERARAAGYRTLVLTVDVPQVSRRIRDLKNGLEMPFRIGARQFVDFALHPFWSIPTAIAGAPRPVNFDIGPAPGFNRTGPRAGADWSFLDRLRAMWPGHLVVKGVSSVEDALRIREAGTDAVWVSNHGGRQLDSAPAALSALPKIRAALGPDYPLLFCSGVRGGDDVLRALALGANFVMLGRPLLFAMGAAGRDGLRDYLDELSSQTDVALAQIGARSPGDVGEHNLVVPMSGPAAPR